MNLCLLFAVIVLAAVVYLPVQAQVPTPPHRFHGVVRVNGGPPADGTAVIAVIGAVECGRGRTADGAYRIDALASSMRPGCGIEGDTVQFRIGNATAEQSARWRGASVSVLPLTARADGYTTAALDLGSPCIPSAGATVCDPARVRLWNGEPEAWTLLYRALGAPAPADDRVFDEVIRLRMEAGDPAVIALFATRLGWPYVKLTAIGFWGTGTAQADEFVEVANLGGAAQLMTGWHIRTGASGADFRFAPASVLRPGQSCRVYTNQTHPDSCPGHGFGSSSPLWDDAAGFAQITVDYPALVADQTRYTADAARQPPPPALRGVDTPR